MSAEVDAILGIGSVRPEFVKSERVKAAADVTLPELRRWNYGPCSRHEEPLVDCEYRQCGGPLLNHQRLGVGWLYAVRRGFLADETGLGKTNHVIFLTTLLKERGELTNRALVVVQTPTVGQWVAEYARFAPGMNVIGATGDRRSRIRKYTSENWDVCVIGYHMLLKDKDVFEHFDLDLLAVDDVDPLKNPDTATHRAVVAIARRTERSVVMNATPLQIRLQDLYSMGVPVGTTETFGPLSAFERRHVRKETHTEWTRKGKKVVREVTVGYKNMEEFKRKFSPMVLRRKYEDVHDVRIPDVAPPEEVWLDLHPAQRRKYDELQKGVLRIIKEEGESVKRATALAKLTYGAEICSSLCALGEPDGGQSSAKGDWLMEKMTGDWGPDGESPGRKAIAFVRFRGTAKMLRDRMAAAGAGSAIIWGGQSKADKLEQVDRFWNDPKCRLMVGTSAIERGLNLQCANIVVNFDTLLNPARMTQILGRSRRVGSRFSRVYVFNLLHAKTQEEGYMKVLRERQALADFVWDQESDLYEPLPPLSLLQLIRP